MPPGVMVRALPLANARKETVVTTDRKARLKEALWRETKTMLWLALYLFAFLAALAGYRAVLLGEGGAGAWPLFHCAVEALVLAKVMLIGNALKLGERFFQRRVISKIVGRALAFAAFALLFSACEELATGWLRGRTSAEMWHELQNFGLRLILARGVVLFIFFIPLFLLWEISRALGEGKLLALVLAPPPPPSHRHAEGSAHGSH